MFQNPFLTRIHYSSWLQGKKTSELILPSDQIFFFFFGKLTYVLKEEDTNIIRGIPQIYNDNRKHKTTDGYMLAIDRKTETSLDSLGNQLTNRLRIYGIHPPSLLDPCVFICWYDIPHQIKLITNDTFDLIKDQIRSSRHSSKEPCIPFLPYIIHCSCKTQFTVRISR